MWDKGRVNRAEGAWSPLGQTGPSERLAPPPRGLGADSAGVPAGAACRVRLRVPRGAEEDPRPRAREGAHGSHAALHRHRRRQVRPRRGGGGRGRRAGRDDPALRQRRRRLRRPGPLAGRPGGVAGLVPGGDGGDRALLDGAVVPPGRRRVARGGGQPHQDRRLPQGRLREAHQDRRGRRADDRRVRPGDGAVPLGGVPRGRRGAALPHALPLPPREGPHLLLQLGPRPARPRVPGVRGPLLPAPGPLVARAAVEVRDPRRVPGRRPRGAVRGAAAGSGGGGSTGSGRPPRARSGSPSPWTACPSSSGTPWRS